MAQETIVEYFNRTGVAFGVVALTAGEQQQLDALTTILIDENKMLKDDVFNIDRDGLETTISFQHDQVCAMLPFSFHRDMKGHTSLLVDKTGGSPVMFDLPSDRVSFCNFLKAELPSRMVRHGKALAMMDYLANKPAPAAVAAPVPSKP